MRISWHAHLISTHELRLWVTHSQWHDMRWDPHVMWLCSISLHVMSRHSMGYHYMSSSFGSVGYHYMCQVVCHTATQWMAVCHTATCVTWYVTLQHNAVYLVYHHMCHVIHVSCHTCVMSYVMSHDLSSRTSYLHRPANIYITIHLHHNPSTSQSIYKMSGVSFDRDLTKSPIYVGQSIYITIAYNQSMMRISSQSIYITITYN